MLKKIILSCFLIVGMSVNVFAVPTVRKLGGTTANTVKTNNTSKSSVLSAKVAKTPATTTKSAKPSTTTSTTERMPTAHAIKKLGGTSIVKKTSSSTPSSGETDESITELKERVTILEDKTNNIINEVEATDGNYVNDINIDGNKLEVNKTRVLYAPVKKENGDLTSDDAEIWIVR